MASDIAAVKAAVDAAFRDEWGRVVATLIRTTGDWDLAEECAQDAFAMALQRWPASGIPARPGAWLTTAARNRAIDVLRRSSTSAAWASALSAATCRKACTRSSTAAIRSRWARVTSVAETCPAASAADSSAAVMRVSSITPPPGFSAP